MSTIPYLATVIDIEKCAPYSLSPSEVAWGAFRLLLTQRRTLLHCSELSDMYRYIYQYIHSWGLICLRLYNSPYSQASSPSVFRVGRDGRLVVVRPDLCLGRTAGPYRCLSLCFIFESHEHYVCVMKKRRIFYSKVEIRLYYHVSNFTINQPMLLVISDPGLYLCIFCSLRLRCGATTEPMGDGLGHMDDDSVQKVVAGACE